MGFGGIFFMKPGGLITHYSLQKLVHLYGLFILFFVIPSIKPIGVPVKLMNVYEFY
jgi:hypothetical protein